MSEKQVFAPNVFSIPYFFTNEECDAAVAESEGHGYEDAPINTSRGAIVRKDVRNNERLMLDDPERAEHLWRCLKPWMPRSFEEKWHPIGINERLRFYRYDVGQKFDWHLDGPYERANGERSHFTFMIYLNADFEGGATSFAPGGYGGARFGGMIGDFRVQPKKGMALVFHHPIQHRGDEVVSGRKYVLRSDVMFARGRGPRDHLSVVR